MTQTPAPRSSDSTPAYTSQRTTRAQVHSTFALFLRKLGGHEATSWNDVGGYTLDYNSIYGGYLIEQITSESGGQSQPFGSSRRKPQEMWYTLHFAIRVLEVAAKAVQQ